MKCIAVAQEEDMKGRAGGNPERLRHHPFR